MSRTHLSLGYRLPITNIFFIEKSNFFEGKIDFRAPLGVFAGPKIDPSGRKKRLVYGLGTKLLSCATEVPTISHFTTSVEIRQSYRILKC